MIKDDNSQSKNLIIVFIFQWTYIAGNNWGTDENGEECVGCGPQEHFRACADISIGQV